MSIPSVFKKHAVVAAVMLIWIPAMALGIEVLLHYSYTPSRLASPPGEWPPGAIGQPGPRREALVLFVHPQCPCSRATIHELAQIMAVGRDSVSAFVYFYAPESEKSEWTRTQLWRDAAAIPGVHVMEDKNGCEARRFGASTSGQALLYDARGQLTFNGGITASRGHIGTNDGEDALIALIKSGGAEHRTAPVFGCSLLSEE